MNTDNAGIMPEMISFTAGENGDQLRVEIPIGSINRLEKLKQSETIKALSRFVLAMVGGVDAMLEQDIDTVLRIEGVVISLPGNQEMINVQELAGSFMISGSGEEIANLREDYEF